MKRSVSSNYLSPCFAPTQIFVATIAFLLPSAEHSTVEADKKVHAGKEGTWNGRDLRALDLSCWNGVVAEECFYCFSTVLLSFISLYFLSWQPSSITCCFSGTVLFFFFCSINIPFLLYCFDVGWLNWKKGTCLFFLTSSVDGLTAALPVGLVHGCSPEFATGTDHHAFDGGPHIP